MKVHSFVNEGDALEYVYKKLGITWEQTENLYISLGGYDYETVVFDLSCPGEDAFSIAMQEFVADRGIQVLSVV